MKDALAWERVFDFEQDVENSPPQGMVIETTSGGQPDVTIQHDPTATAKSQFLVMHGASFPGVNSLFCLVWFSNIKDGSMDIRLKHGGEEDLPRTAGLVWRYQSKDDTYSIAWDTRKSTLTLSVIVQGKSKVLKREKMVLAPHQWATLSVNFHGSNIECAVNHNPIFHTNDSSLKESGKVGLLLQSNAPIFFDDFRIRGEN